MERSPKRAFCRSSMAALPAQIEALRDHVFLTIGGHGGGSSKPTTAKAAGNK